MIVDASLVLSSFFPDEAKEQAQALIRDHIAGRLELESPTLLLYEVANGVLQAVHRDRITEAEGTDILTSFEGLGITLAPVAWQQILPLAQRFDRTAYDAAYLTLAEATGQSLITGDERLYNAVHEHLSWVTWIEDYQGAS